MKIVYRKFKTLIYNHRLSINVHRQISKRVQRNVYTFIVNLKTTNVYFRKKVFDKYKTVCSERIICNFGCEIYTELHDFDSHRYKFRFRHSAFVEIKEFGNANCILKVCELKYSHCEFKFRGASIKNISNAILDFYPTNLKRICVNLNKGRVRLSIFLCANSIHYISQFEI